MICQTFQIAYGVFLHRQRKKEEIFRSLISVFFFINFSFFLSRENLLTCIRLERLRFICWNCWLIAADKSLVGEEILHRWRHHSLNKNRSSDKESTHVVSQLNVGKKVVFESKQISYCRYLMRSYIKCI